MFAKSKLFAAIICAVLVTGVFAGCNIHDIVNNRETSYESYVQVTAAVQAEQTETVAADIETVPPESTTPNSAAFQEVYNEYAEALAAKTPVLISEFSSEINNSSDTADAQALLEEKLNDLEDIYCEGLAQFVIIVGKTSASDDEYEYWYEKLKNIYDIQVEELTKSCAMQSNIEYGEDMDY